MKNYPHPLIAREGWPFLAGAVLVALALSWLAPWWLAILAWLVAFFILQFFRDPAREIPTQSNAVLCPADGRVIKVEPEHDPYLDRNSLKISVFMNVFNVHSQRSPLDGKVEKVWYNRGSFLNAAVDKASTENERNALHLTTTDGQAVTCVQVAGLVARRILCYVNAGDTLARGQRYGFIRFGSRVDVYLPTSARACVTIGQKVRATETVLAELR
ncbi:MAG: phosphatidylserine decarboxylase [Proteobacteria bacterium]|nr:phosphatidylserine decarboxylase [Pseudomonadota bacterium]MCL2310060.1 phosphatidylserine decarboxylase [Pseudomonadota bacterium]